MIITHVLNAAEKEQLKESEKMTKYCPSCHQQVDDDNESCPYCGWKPGRYTRFDSDYHEFPVMVVPGHEEVKFQDRIHVKRMRKISQLRPKDRTLYLNIMEVLQNNKELAYSKSELRDRIIGSTKGMTKILNWMMNQGMVRKGYSQGQEFYCWNKDWRHEGPSKEVIDKYKRR